MIAVFSVENPVKATEISVSYATGSTVVQLLEGTIVVATRSGKFFLSESLWNNQKLQGKAANSMEDGLDSLIELRDLLESATQGKPVPLHDAHAAAVKTKAGFEPIGKMIRAGATPEGQNILSPRMEEIQDRLENIVEALSPERSDACSACEDPVCCKTGSSCCSDQKSCPNGCR